MFPWIPQFFVSGVLLFSCTSRFSTDMPTQCSYFNIILTFWSICSSFQLNLVRTNRIFPCFEVNVTGLSDSSSSENICPFSIFPVSFGLISVGGNYYFNVEIVFKYVFLLSRFSLYIFAMFILIVLLRFALI